MNKKYEKQTYSILSGVLITVITGFIPNVFPLMLGSDRWGYLLPWLRRIVYPGAPLEIVLTSFVADVLIWSVLTYLFLISVNEVEKKPVKRPARRRKR